jgi:dTDP-4-dehydrorhamnose reductase
LAEAFAAAEGLIHLSTSGQTSWHGFAEAIITGLRSRGVPVAAKRVRAIPTSEYPTKARRPLNSRLDLSRLQTVFGIRPRMWQDALGDELDILAQQL